MTTPDLDKALITLDIDWAPDKVIDYVAAILREYRVRSTWFVTHSSLAIERLRKEPELFELGIHPNFQANSTHGITVKEVLDHCMTIVPEAKSLRTHSLIQSSPLLADVMSKTPITTDVSQFLPHASHIQPVAYCWQGKTLMRLPFFWEDDLEMERPDPWFEWDPQRVDTPGYKVFNFHPIHVYLNSKDMNAYQALKNRRPDLINATIDEMSSLVQEGNGAKTFFIDIVKNLAETGRSCRIQDVHAIWQTEHPELSAWQ